MQPITFIITCREPDYNEPSYLEITFNLSAEGPAEAEALAKQFLAIGDRAMNHQVSYRKHLAGMHDPIFYRQTSQKLEEHRGAISTDTQLHESDRARLLYLAAQQILATREREEKVAQEYREDLETARLVISAASWFIPEKDGPTWHDHLYRQSGLMTRFRRKVNSLWNMDQAMVAASKPEDLLSGYYSKHEFSEDFGPEEIPF
jgi:hypothetical protein